MKRNYRIKYSVTLNSLSGKKELTGKEIIVRNRENDLWAKLSLEDYLRKKHGEAFVSYSVLSCEPEFDNPFENLFSRFSKW